MNGWVVFLITLAVLAVLIFVLYRVGTKAQAKRDQQRADIEAAKQPTTMLIIDKKRLPMKSSGLPQAVIDNTPWYLRRSKIAVVKAKVGPRIFTLACDDKVFDIIPVKKEVKAEVSGMYIVGVKGLRGSLDTQPGKLSIGQRLRRWSQDKLDNAKK